MRGRKPKPSKLRLLEGNVGKRPINKAEPQVTDGIGEPPEILNKQERAIWEKRAKVGYWLTAGDRGIFQINVMAYAMMERVKPRLEEAPLISKGPNGGPIQNPYLAIMNKAKEQAIKTDAELGFTPSSRSRITIPKKDNKKSRMQEWRQQKKQA